MAKVKIGLRGLSAAQKIEKAKSVIATAEKSEAVDEKALPLAALEKAAAMLEKASEMAEFGDKRAVAAKKLCEKQTENAIRSAAYAAEQLSKGDPRIIRACGFEVRSTNNRSAPPGIPEKVTAKRREDTVGAVILKWQPVKNSKSYLVQMCAADHHNEHWETGSFTTRSRCVIDALKPGKVYRFRISAIGAKGIGPPSAEVSIMAA